MPVELGEFDGSLSGELDWCMIGVEINLLK